LAAGDGRGAFGGGGAGGVGFVGREGVAAGGGVDDAGHAGLAVGGGGAVEPDGVGVFYCYLEDVGLWGISFVLYWGGGEEGGLTSRVWLMVGIVGRAIEVVWRVRSVGNGN
jgi:hypothetical protein